MVACVVHSSKQYTNFCRQGSHCGLHSTHTAFGIYILTYPGDFHLSTVLVRSIQAVSPEIPIVIIPGEGFDLEDHPFDVSILPPPTSGFWAELGHIDRKFWAFQGPFDVFLYLDADTIVVRSLDALAKRLVRQDGDFLMVQFLMDAGQWRRVMETPAHEEYEIYRGFIARDIGRGPLARFDPDHDFYAHQPFNAGVWASRRSAIKESDLCALVDAERRFYRQVLGIDHWTWHSGELFFRDQGRLNYLAHKLRLAVLPFGEEFRWVSGAACVHVSLADVTNQSCPFHLIHWMGSKSPSPSWFCAKPLFPLYAWLWAWVGRRTGRYVEPGYEALPECAGYSVWRYHHLRLNGKFRLSDRLRASWKDLRRVAKLTTRWIRMSVTSVIAPSTK